MTEIAGVACRTVLGMTLIAFAASGALARAQDDDDLGDAEMPAVAQPRPVQDFLAVPDANFNAWVFGNLRTPAAARERLDTSLSVQVEDVARTCAITEAQRRKLLLAGRGDIKRFFDRVEDERKRFRSVVQRDQDKVQEFVQRLQPLRATLISDVFVEGSIFAKTIRNTLDPAQAAIFEDALRVKRLFLYKAKVEMVVQTVGRAVGLSSSQRERFARLLVEETRPPQRFGQYDFYVVMYQAARLPEDKLRPIFDNAQWGALRRQFAQGQQMEALLRNGGFLPEEGEGRRQAPNAPR